MSDGYVKVADGEDIMGRDWEVGTRGDVLVVRFGNGLRFFDDEDGGREKFAEAATAAGQVCRRACCDHCNNGEGDPAGHDYTLSGPHDGPCPAGCPVPAED